VGLIMRRVAYLFWKELIELKEDPRLLAVVIVAPIIQLLMLGYAATTDVQNVPVAVADADQSAESRRLVEQFTASRNFTVVDVVSAPQDVDGFLERGRAWMAIVIPRGYGAALAAGEPQAVQIVADGSDANSTSIGMSYARNLIAGYGAAIAASRGRAAPAGSSAPRRMAPDGPGGLESRIRIWFNPELESRDFMIPGILALLLLVVTTNLSSMAIVREREAGTLEQLNVTPLRRWELVAGKLLPYGVVGMIDVVLVVALAVWWFEVPLRGSITLLFAMTGVYLLTALGLGLLVSAVSSTQQQAMMTTVFFFLMPMMYLSGFIFPIENMPRIIQQISYAIPLRYFLVILRSVFLKGVGLETLWRDALALLGLGLLITGLAVLGSRKRASS
jgi:ABC-2 type transport system permease protein